MNEIPNINISGNTVTNIPNNLIGIPNGPSIIPTIDPPVTKSTTQSVIRNLEAPVFRFTDPSLNYPILNVPTQDEFNAAVAAEKKKKQEEEKEEKSRKLLDTPTINKLPQIIQPLYTSPTNEVPVRQPPPVELLNNNTNLGVPVIEVPIIGQVPIPPKEQVLLAGTTATASVAAALIGKSMVEWMVAKMKPIVNQIFVRGKKLLNKDLTPYETQILFAFDKEVKMKKIAKLLKKEQKAEKLKQFKDFYNK